MRRRKQSYTSAIREKHLKDFHSFSFIDSKDFQVKNRFPKLEKKGKKHGDIKDQGEEGADPGSRITQLVREVLDKMAAVTGMLKGQFTLKLHMSPLACMILGALLKFNACIHSLSFDVLQPYIKEMQSTVELMEQRCIFFILNYAEQ